MISEIENNKNIGGNMYRIKDRTELPYLSDMSLYIDVILFSTYNLPPSKCSDRSMEV